MRVGKSVVQLLHEQHRERHQLRRRALSRRGDARPRDLDEHGRRRLGGLGRRGEHGLRGRHRVRRRRRQQLLRRHLRRFRRIDRLSRALPPRDRRVRRHGRSPAVLRPAVRDDAGQLGAGEQDGDGDGGVHAEHQLGGARAAPDIVDMDGSGTSSATPQIAAAAALYLQQHGRTLFDSTRYPERVDVGRGGAPRRCSRRPTGTPTAAAPRSSAAASCGRPRRWRSARRSPRRCTRRRLTAPWFPLLRVLTGSRRRAVAEPWTTCWSSRPRSSLHRWSTDRSAEPA